MTEPSLAERLQAGLLVARRARDDVATSALRATLAELSNAEAPPMPPTSSLDPPVVGLVEHARLELTMADHERILREQIELRVVAAREYDELGQLDAAARLRGEADVLRRYDGQAEVHLAERCYLEAWRLLASCSDGGAVHETDDLLFTATTLPVPNFNSGFVRPGADPAACIKATRDFFRARGAPFMLRFRGDAAALDACIAAGLEPDMSHPVMVAAVADIATPVDVDIRRVEATSWVDHAGTVEAAFGAPPGFLAPVLPETLAEQPGYAAFALYVEGEVAATAALVVVDDIAGIYNVGTREAFRRRGFGGAVTAAAVAEGARRGCRLTTLQASAMGHPVYERMGFRTVTTWMSVTGR